jgi:[CysO sulfur-carrier protein]-S-L-cysteine hydrolase
VRPCPAGSRRLRRWSSLAAMRMSRASWEAMVEHALEETPNECCGYVQARDGTVEEVFRGRSMRRSRYAYELDPQSLLRANELDDEGFQVGIYHSHPRSPAEPSQTDINLAHYPHWTYLIVSLQADPVIRAWRIGDGRVEEEPVVVAD